MTMSVTFRLMVIAAFFSLCGCPLGSSRDHYRPPGHSDTTIDVSPQDDAILFNAAGTGGRDLFLLSLSDFKVTRIAETPEYETTPSFSPDGQSIVYAAGIPGDRADHIFVMGRDGGAKTQLTDSDANDTSPRFSPDGKLIVFARDKSHNWGGLAASWELGGVICRMDADGGNLRQLTPDEEYAFEPHFSADGTHIVYSTLNGRMSLAVDGSTEPEPIAGPLAAVPSHDGKRIAYSKGTYSPDLKIFIADADGTSERVLTPGMGGCSRPVFNHADDALYFLSEEWPNGPSGVPKFRLWRAIVDGPMVDAVSDLGLFDDPQNWKPQDQP
jgi:Tol biopolymer transport system component